jgi:hypothetical protein
LELRGGLSCWCCLLGSREWLWTSFPLWQVCKRTLGTLHVLGGVGRGRAKGTLCSLLSLRALLSHTAFVRAELLVSMSLPLLLLPL